MGGQTLKNDVTLKDDINFTSSPVSQSSLLKLLLLSEKVTLKLNKQCLDLKYHFVRDQNPRVLDQSKN